MVDNVVRPLGQQYRYSAKSNGLSQKAVSMKRRNGIARLASIPPLVVGVVLGWLAASVFFMTSDFITVSIALLVLYFVTAWELRWWQSVRRKIPVSILIGAFAILLLAPRAQGFFPIDSVSDLFRFAGPFSSVNWAITGSSIALAIVFLVAPMDNLAEPQEAELASPDVPQEL